MWTLLTRSLTVAVLAILLLAGESGPGSPPAASAQHASSMGEILLTFGPGGVLTEGGILWQFNMEKGVWTTIDDAFDEQGRQTHVHPLPVAADEIARMESFGFIVTHSGNCWLYDLEKDRWREIGPPPRRR